MCDTDFGLQVIPTAGQGTRREVLFFPADRVPPYKEFSYFLKSTVKCSGCGCQIFLKDK
jgi:hypothetical protein